MSRAKSTIEAAFNALNAPAPLLLTDRAQTMEEQAMESAWTNGMPGGLHICWVDTIGIDSPIPDSWRMRDRVGCIVCDNGSEEDFICGRAEDYRSFVLFLPWAFWRAWAIARQLVKSHPGLSASVATWETVGTHIIVAPFHRISVDGREVRR